MKAFKIGCGRKNERYEDDNICNISGNYLGYRLKDIPDFWFENLEIYASTVEVKRNTYLSKTLGYWNRKKRKKISSELNTKYNEHMKVTKEEYIKNGYTLPNYANILKQRL